MAELKKIKIKIEGDDLAELFLKAAREVSVTQTGEKSEDLKSFLSGHWEEVKLAEKEKNKLLASWLEKILALSNKNKKTYQYFSLLNFAETGLVARLIGQSAPRGRENNEVFVLEGASIKEAGKKWGAEITLATGVKKTLENARIKR